MEHDGYPNVERQPIENAEEGSGGDSDDGERLEVEFHRAAEDGGVGLELLAPQCVTDHHHRCSSEIIRAIACLEKASDLRSYAKGGEEIT